MITVDPKIHAEIINQASRLLGAKDLLRTEEVEALTEMSKLMAPIVAATGGHFFQKRLTFNGTHGVDREKTYPHWMMALAGPGPDDEGGRDDTCGRTRGWRLYLREDGAFVAFDYRGSWSRWQDGRCWWKATIRELTPAQVAEEFTTADILKEAAAECSAETLKKLQAKTAMYAVRAKHMAIVTETLKLKV